MNRRSWVTTTRVVCRSGLELVEDLVDLVAGLAVELAGRLVGEDDHRVLDQGPGDRDPLLLAARELPGAMVQAIAQADRPEQLGGLPALGVGHAGRQERHQGRSAGPRGS